MSSLENEVRLYKQHQSEAEQDWTRVSKIIKEGRHFAQKALLIFYKKYHTHPLGNPKKEEMDLLAKQYDVDFTSMGMEIVPKEETKVEEVKN
jgi:hypothetical protein